MAAIVIPGKLTYKNLSKKQRSNIINDFVSPIFNKSPKLKDYIKNHTTNRIIEFQSIMLLMVEGKEVLNPPKLVSLLEGINQEAIFRIV